MESRGGSRPVKHAIISSSTASRRDARDRVSPSRLLIPALRADSDGTFAGQWPSIEAALALGVGGFILFGGTAENVGRLVSRLRATSSHGLLIGSDLERGAGQQFVGATSLPPPAALAATDDPHVAFEAGRITAAEAAFLGVNWLMAPVADLDVEPRNPIVSTRSFGADPGRVATLVASWVEGCQAGGGLACVKHFPGHGRTTSDSHVERPVVTSTRELLQSTDLVPFRAAFDAGASSVMTAHVAYSALDPSGEVATLSAPILQELLRGELGFGGLVVSDALGMAGVSGVLGEGEAAVRALEAGCDLLLYPEEAATVVDAVEAAVESGRVRPEGVAKSIERLEQALADAGARETGALRISPENNRWADEAALRSLRVLRGSPRLPQVIDLLELDDDIGGPFPPTSRSEFGDLLKANRAAVPGKRPFLVAIYADPRAWKGRAGLSADTVDRAGSALERAPEATLVLFGHPRLLEQLPAARHVLCAWGGDAVMQRAAARWLLSDRFDQA